MRIAALCAFIFASSTCISADRIDKVQTLMEAQGLVKIFEQQIDAGKLEQRRQAQQMLSQLLTQLKPSKEYETRFRSAADDFTKSLDAPWKAEDMVDVWAKAYGSRFTDQELDQLVAFYTSPLGKGDVIASQATMPELIHHFSALATPLIERAMKQYIQRLQLIAKDCNCKE